MTIKKEYRQGLLESICCFLFSSRAASALRSTLSMQSAVSHSGRRKHAENPTAPGVQRSVLQRRPSPSTSVGRWTEPHRLDVQRSVDSDEFWSPCLETVYLVVSEL